MRVYWQHVSHVETHQRRQTYASKVLRGSDLVAGLREAREAEAFASGRKDLHTDAMM